MKESITAVQLNIVNGLGAGGGAPGRGLTSPRAQFRLRPRVCTNVQMLARARNIRLSVTAIHVQSSTAHQLLGPLVNYLPGTKTEICIFRTRGICESSRIAVYLRLFLHILSPHRGLAPPPTTDSIIGIVVSPPVSDFRRLLLLALPPPAETSAYRQSHFSPSKLAPAAAAAAATTTTCLLFHRG